MGSKSDYPVAQKCIDILENFNVKQEVSITSAHRTPQRTKDYITTADRKGAEIFICMAGMAAHLAGAVCSMTTKPVIGVPIKGGAMDGLDALLSTVQMPAGMPVATVAIGNAGSINAAYLAIQILALNDSDLKDKLAKDREQQIKKVENDSKEIEKIL